MNAKDEVFLIVTTVANEEQSTKLLSTLFSERLAACVSVTQVKSHYLWQGKLVENGELQLQIKTSAKAYDALVKKIAEVHPYDTPEILCFQPCSASSKYASWVKESCSNH